MLKSPIDYEMLCHCSSASNIFQVNSNVFLEGGRLSSDVIQGLLSTSTRLWPLTIMCLPSHLWKPFRLLCTTLPALHPSLPYLILGPQNSIEYHLPTPANLLWTLLVQIVSSLADIGVCRNLLSIYLSVCLSVLFSPSPICIASQAW